MVAESILRVGEIYEVEEPVRVPPFTASNPLGELAWGKMPRRYIGEKEGIARFVFPVHLRGEVYIYTMPLSQIRVHGTDILNPSAEFQTRLVRYGRGSSENERAASKELLRFEKV